jgi:hypothetical protein
MLMTIDELMKKLGGYRLSSEVFVSQNRLLIVAQIGNPMWIEDGSSDLGRGVGSRVMDLEVPVK